TAGKQEGDQEDEDWTREHLRGQIYPGRAFQRAAQAHVTNSACVIQGAGTAGELAAFGPETSKERYFSGRRHVLLAPNPVLHFAPTSILPRLLGALLLLCVAGMGQAQAQAQD